MGVAGAVLTDGTGFAASVRPALLPMTRLARRLAPDCDPQDVVGDAVERAWRTRSSYRADRGTATAWLLAITASVARDAQRRSSRRERVLSGVHEPEPVAVDVPDLDLDRAVRALPERQQLAVHCFYFLDLPVSETAQVMGCAEGTVKALLHKARLALRDRLGGTR